MKSDGSKWFWNGKLLKDINCIPECCPFAVYTIVFNNGDYYIGSKQIYNTRNVKLSKKRANELYSGKGRKPTKERKVTESDWKTYQSSSKIVQQRLNSGEPAMFMINQFFETKAEMLLYEGYCIIKSFLDKTDSHCLNGWVSVRQNKPKI